MRRQVRTAVISVLLLCSMLLASCGDAAVSGQAASTLRVGIPAVTDSFDFFNAPNGYESYSMAQIYDTLLRKDENGSYVPGLADSYEISDDAKVFTFRLDPDVKWSDETPVTSSDVAFSMQKLKESKYVSYIYEPLLDTVETPDAHTVVIRLTKPSVSFLEYLANPFYSAVLSEKAYEKYGDRYGTSVDTIVSSGPYRLTEWNVGTSLVYEANEQYYRDVPSIKHVELMTMSDSSSAMMALQTGEIDVYFDDVPGVSRDMMMNRDDIRVFDYTSTALYCIFLNTREGLFTDPDMRRAVALAVNRQDYVTVGTEGYGEVADYPGDRDDIGDPELHGIWDEYYGAGIDAAKKLVKKCGCEGRKVVIKTYSTNPYPELATVLQDALNRIGLKAEVEQIERAAFIDQVLDHGDFEIQICRWAAATEDMDEIVYGSLHSDSIGAPGNWSFYTPSPEMDELITSVAGESDEAARKEMYGTIIRQFVSDCVYIPLYYPTSSRAYDSNLEIRDGLQKYDLFDNYSWRKEAAG